MSVQPACVLFQGSSSSRYQVGNFGVSRIEIRSFGSYSKFFGLFWDFQILTLSKAYPEMLLSREVLGTPPALEALRVPGRAARVRSSPAQNHVSKFVSSGTPISSLKRNSHSDIKWALEAVEHLIEPSKSWPKVNDASEKRTPRRSRIT